MLAIFLTACGGAGVTTSNVLGESEANAQRGNRQGNDPNAGIDDARAAADYTSEGGIPGCFDPNLSGRQRAVAERLGGVPCEGSTVAGSTGGSGADGWPGRYEGQFDGGRGLVTISPATSAGYHQVQVEVAGGGCSGQATVSARPNGNRMSLEIPVENNQGLCVIDLTRSGSTLRVGESYCAELHGMSCGFSGTATRAGGGAAASRPAPGGGGSASWLVGAWVERGEDCGGDSGLIFDSNGVYSSGDESGRWTLHGNNLSFTALETAIMAEDGARPIRNPRALLHRVLRVGPAAFQMRGPDGRLWNMMRCR